ncbi:MAG: SH3 domain-containing protein [Kosmotogaceae bacterium]
MRYKVTKTFKSDLESFIELNKGERVYKEGIYEGNEKWPNWIYCKKLDSKEEGWVPLQILEKEGETVVAKEHYSAREMNVDKGEIVEGIKRLNGWIWCLKESGNEGWVPEENLNLIDHDFEELYNKGLKANFKGWEFSYLDNRMITVDEIPWNYRDIVRKYLAKAMNLLDMGTGGGEFLASLSDLPKNTCATESYKPNIPVARKRLEPLGIEVREFEDDENLPFEEDSFDLVINRHDSYQPEELTRIMKEKGIFVTQQVGELDNVELNHFFDDHSRDENEWCLINAINELKKAGFDILKKNEVFPETFFTDITAVVYYLKVIQWQIPGIELDSPVAKTKLKKLHEIIIEEGSFKTKQHRFVIIAKKP